MAISHRMRKLRDGVVLPYERCGDDDYCRPGPVTVRKMTPEELAKYGPPQNRPVPAHLANLKKIYNRGGSKMDFQVPEGEDWRKVLTPQKYLELKRAGWSDSRIRKAAGITSPVHLTNWKKEHGLAGLALKSGPKSGRATADAVGEQNPGVDEEASEPLGEAVQEPTAAVVDGVKEVLPPVAEPEPESGVLRKLPEGKQWTDVVSRDEVAAVVHLTNAEAAKALRLPKHAYKRLKRAYGFARPPLRRVKTLTVTQALAMTAELQREIECCERLQVMLSEDSCTEVGHLIQRHREECQLRLERLQTAKVVI